MRATWIADVLRADGLRVLELAGWKTRESRAGFDPAGIVCHHTASSPAASNEAVRALLRDGRSDLSGPLCQLGLERDGLFVCIAAGRANHNGYGRWGNDSFGVEAYNDGRGEPWPAVQMDAYRRGVAAICRHLGWGPAQVMGHKETDPNRKIDPTFDMAAFRAGVSRLIDPPEDDVTPEQDARLKNVERLLEALVPRAPRKVSMALATLGDTDADGTPVADIWRWTLAEVTNPAVIAASIPEDLAAQVAAELAKRLQS